jgi:HlyD family secretion protein
MMRKNITPLLIVIVVGFALAFSMALIHHGKVFMHMHGGGASKSSGAPTEPAQPFIAPAQSPYPTFVAGAGIVEASTENIAIAPFVGGVVSEINVRVGSRVKKSDPLFSIDSRATRAELAVRRAAVQVAEAQLEEAQNLFARAESITNAQAMSVEDRDNRRYAVEIAKAQLAQAQANIQSSKTDLDRMTVRAPVDGDVLQLNVHLGEFAPANAVSPPAILFGNTQTLHVRVDVDEEDAWRVRVGEPATGFLRGNKDIKTPLQFVRIEPYVVPKLSLTGDPTERVDTRVLQVIYSFKPGDLPIHVGQQMDVYIEAPDQKSLTAANSNQP